MTPKEKAKELVDKFYQTTPHEIWINQPIGLKEEYKAWEQSKQCALIAVDEILEVTGGHINQFYQQVKQEIEKI